MPWIGGRAWEGGSGPFPKMPWGAAWALSHDVLAQGPPEQIDRHDLKHLLAVIINRLICGQTAFQGRRYVGPRGQDCAAARIQATWRMYQERGRYLEYRRKKWAAGVICISWVMSVKMSKVRKQLAATRMDQLEIFRKQARVSTLNTT